MEVSNTTFGPLIAYLVPGATVLFGLRDNSPMIQSWFMADPSSAPTIGGFLYLTVASIAVGMTISAIRWLLVDTLHRLMGLAIPSLDFGRLGSNVDAFGLLIDIHYQHYLFYSNEAVALAIAYAAYRARLGVGTPLWSDLAFILLEVVFLVTSRDTLRKYYARGSQLLGRGSTSSIHGPKGMRLRNSKSETP